VLNRRCLYEVQSEDEDEEVGDEVEAVVERLKK
jgi:hypothetical protein